MKQRTPRGWYSRHKRVSSGTYRLEIGQSVAMKNSRWFCRGAGASGVQERPSTSRTLIASEGVQQDAGQPGFAEHAGNQQKQEEP